MDQLKNTNQLLHNDQYLTCLEKIRQCEEQRIFCRHDLAHFLAVARIAMIKVLEADLGLSRDLVYTTALLHDIGRFVQYQNKTPHEIASHDLALPLLDTLDYSEDEKKLILEAILNHRNPKTQGFNRIFYESDKISRECFCCPAQTACDWPKQKKNLELRY
jgi:hypothetical protein